MEWVGGGHGTAGVCSKPGDVTPQRTCTHNFDLNRDVEQVSLGAAGTGGLGAWPEGPWPGRARACLAWRGREEEGQEK